MAARALEARLTLRLLALAGPVLVGVACAAVLVTDRALEANDTRSALGAAQASLDSLDRELAEGDGPDEALAEVVAAGEQEGIQLVVRTAGHTLATALGDRLGAVPVGSCVGLEDGRGTPWRACSIGDPRATAIAAVATGEHRATLGLLSRWMGGVLLVGLLALVLAVRQALRAPVLELTSLVRWTDRVVDSESLLAPPAADTREIARLEAAFEALVRRLLDELARARANSAHIAHELRTPLTSILAELGALESSQGEAVARIRSDVARLADVIEAILVLSDPRAKGRTGTIVNVADLARDLAPADVTLEAPDEALVDADERLLSLAIRNLVDNAHKHAGGVRAIRVSREGRQVRLTVQDAGAGLDERAREQMFERYWRGSADGPGRGLGLALVRAVAERYGGTAEAGPGDDGVGLRVSMTLDGLVRWHELEPRP